MARRGYRNYDAGARPGSHYEEEVEVIRGREKIPKPRKLRHETQDTKKKLPWRSPHGPS